MKPRNRVKYPAFCMQTLPLQTPPKAPRAPAGALTPPPPRARMPAPALGTTRPRPAAPVDTIAGEDAARRGGCRPRNDARNDARRGKYPRPGTDAPPGESVRRGRVFIVSPPGEFLRGAGCPPPSRRRGGCPPGRMPPAVAPGSVAFMGIMATDAAAAPAPGFQTKSQGPRAGRPKPLPLYDRS